MDLADSSQRQTLPRSTTISFSAGTRQPDPAKYRLVSGTSGEKLSALLRVFPSLRASFLQSPLLINAYPASFNPPEEMLFVDTYGRWQSFSAALSLSGILDKPVVVVAMPLTAAHLIHSTLQAVARLPQKVTLLLGGYHCPASLEKHLIQFFGEAGVELSIFHLYGIGELEAALLAGRRDSESGTISYYSIDSNWAPLIQRGELVFSSIAHSNQTFSTGDQAAVDGSGILLSVPSVRLTADICNELESWSSESWSRRTGFIVRQGSELRLQCRRGILPVPAHGELDFFDFMRLARFDWLDKPNWS